MWTSKNKMAYGAVVAAFGLALVALTPAPGQAIEAVQSCSWTCSSNCELAGDFDCTNQSGIVLSGGTNLDMKGHTLSCTTNCPPAAVTMNANGSTLNNSFGAQGIEATITGAFGTFIDCGGKSSSVVNGIHIISPATGSTAVTGIKNCSKISQNVLVNTGRSHAGKGVSTGGISTSDFTSDNYFDGWNIAVFVSSTKTAKFERNQITIRDTFANEVGFWVGLGTTATLQFNNNSFYEDLIGPADLFLVFAGTHSFDQNYCDPTDESCGPCQNAGQCSRPVVPFPNP